MTAVESLHTADERQFDPHAYHADVEERVQAIFASDPRSGLLLLRIALLAKEREVVPGDPPPMTVVDEVIRAEVPLLRRIHERLAFGPASEGELRVLTRWEKHGSEVNEGNFLMGISYADKRAAKIGLQVNRGDDGYWRFEIRTEKQTRPEDDSTVRKAVRDILPAVMHNPNALPTDILQTLHYSSRRALRTRFPNTIELQQILGRALLEEMERALTATTRTRQEEAWQRAYGPFPLGRVLDRVKKHFGTIDLDRDEDEDEDEGENAKLEVPQNAQIFPSVAR